MGKNSARRLRRSAAQLHALASVERTISKADTVSRCRYLKEYSRAFQKYEQVLQASELEEELSRAEIILIGDYHALPASQEFAAFVLEKLAALHCAPVLFCVEAFVARDQRILDEWFRREIDSEELRERVRFDSDWGYDWRPYRGLLETARKVTAGVYGLDCPPRSDMRTIVRRDRHAAKKISELREANPGAKIVVLFGESHLAPNHLPGLLRQMQPEAKAVTVLQNVDALYWQAAGEPGASVAAVRVEKDVLCAFTSTPLEKYENYRLYIEQWRRERPSVPDLAPSFYNLIESLDRFLKLSQTGVKFSADSLPEISSGSSRSKVAKRLGRVGLNAGTIAEIQAAIHMRGSCYVPKVRTIFARRFQMPEAAEEAARFVHSACQLDCGGAGPAVKDSAEDGFYVRVLEHAIAYLGSKILCPGRVVACVPDASIRVGQMLGTHIHDAYVSGRISKRYLRSLFLLPIRRASVARLLYFGIVAQLRSRARTASPRFSLPAQMVS